MNKTSAIIINFLKKKNTLIGIGVIIICFLISLFISSLFKGSIRAQEIEAVVQNEFDSAQFETVNESEFLSLLKSKRLTIVGLIDSSDNPSYDELNKMFNQKESIDNLPDTVYIYEPIYNQSKITKQFQIKDKNTFFIIDGEEEIGRYSFNKLNNGYQQLVEQIDTIINPKIERKKPIRNNTSSSGNKDKPLESSGAIDEQEDY